jgi:hypothetical protein
LSQQMRTKKMRNEPYSIDTNSNSSTCDSPHTLNFNYSPSEASPLNYNTNLNTNTNQDYNNTTSQLLPPPPPKSSNIAIQMDTANNLDISSGLLNRSTIDFVDMNPIFDDLNASFKNLYKSCLNNRNFFESSNFF